VLCDYPGRQTFRATLYQQTINCETVLVSQGTERRDDF